VRIYLFGSEARGESGPDSDVDFLDVLPDDAPERVTRSGEVYLRLSGFGVAKDVVPWRRSDFERRAAHVKASFPATVAASPEDALVRLLETQEERERWLFETSDTSTQRFSGASNNWMAARVELKINSTLTGHVLTRCLIEAGAMKDQRVSVFRCNSSELDLT
jgi:hypothetical protein